MSLIFEWPSSNFHLDNVSQWFCNDASSAVYESWRVQGPEDHYGIPIFMLSLCCGNPSVSMEFKNSGG